MAHDGDGDRNDRSPSVGWQFGDYEVLDEIGRGGMGAVYKAVQQSLDREVALKMIHAEQEQDPRDLARFQREAQIVAKVKHPNIVQVFEAGQICGQSYFAMEYVKGQDLDQATADGPLEPENAARYVAKVARAVGHLHSQGILHRDLKPSNILIDGEDEPRVTDFGIARAQEHSGEDTTTGSVLGSPSYMAPEQAATEMGPSGPWTDVHGLGAILYRLLTGRPPFEAESAMDTMLQAVQCAPPRPSSLNPKVPGTLEAICLQCLEKKPARRYPSAEHLAADLDRFAAGEVVERAELGPGTRLRRWVHRETNLAVHVVALMVVAAAKLLSYLALAGPRADLLVSGLVAIWVVSSLILRRAQPALSSTRSVGIAWGAMDVAFITAALLLHSGISSPAIVGYAVIIVASGLWLRIWSVALTTLLSLGAILVLALDSILWHTARRLAVDGYVIVAVTICATGLLVIRSVRSTRALSRYPGAG